ncbi:PDZ domain-containing protein [Streptomyces sp. L06]|nr:PDZ domain-containing protein [Streptomyces sp. L06]
MSPERPTESPPWGASLCPRLTRMSGLSAFSRPRAGRRGALALTLVATGVAAAQLTCGLPGDDRPAAGDRPAAQAPAAAHDAVVEAAARAEADGKSGADAAAEAVSRSGDRWGTVYDPEEYAAFEQALDGRYTGVGLRVRARADGAVEVARVQEAGPAERAGIRPGDLLRAIDGRAVTGLPSTEVVRLLRGGADAVPGSQVTLATERSGRARVHTLSRARLHTESVTVGRLPHGAVRIKVTAFTKGSGDEVRSALAAAPGRAGLVLDLRGNSGGLVTEAVTTASTLLDGGLVATYDVRGEPRSLHARPGGDTGRPVVVLVDGATMSAAELLAGALQDRGRAVVVGSRTYGKGSVQMPTRLPGGSVAELTVGHYRTPSGRGLDGRGLTPDLEAEGGDVAERAETVLSGLGSPS